MSELQELEEELGQMIRQDFEQAMEKEILENTIRWLSTTFPYIPETS